MAGVDFIRLGAASNQNLAASRGETSVSASGAKQFEHFLQDSNVSQDNSNTVETVKKSNAPDAALSKNQSYSKREELSASQSEESVSQSGDVAASTQKGLSSEEAEELAVLQEKIRDVIKDNLGIDDDMIDTALQAMGVILTDLFQPEVLQQFVLLVAGGEESTDFLINEDLMQNFTNLLQALEDFQAENQETLLPLMEKLETPVLLDDYLQQEGFTAEKLGISEDASPDEFHVVMESVQAGVSEEELQRIGGKSGSVSDVRQSSLSGSEESEEVWKDVVVLQNADEESGEDSVGQNSSDLLFSQERELSEEKTIPTPLFTEQFNTLQEDGITFIKPQWNGTQRMQQMVDIVNQVSEHIRSAVSADTTSVEIQLNPESLGKVFFSVVSKGGVMTASFQVQTEEAKNALESQILILRDNLEAKNLKVESVEVQVSDFSFDQSNQAERQSQEEMAKQSRRKFRYDTEEAEETEKNAEVTAEQVRRQVMRDNGGSIDFTA